MPDQPVLSDESVVALQDLPPSAKLVAKMLEYEGELTQSKLAEKTLLPGRTVRHALTLLEDERLVLSRISFIDARQRVYSLADSDADDRRNSTTVPTS